MLADGDDENISQDSDSVHDIRERWRRRVLVAGTCHLERLSGW